MARFLTALGLGELGLEAEAGQIKAGMRADMVVLAGDLLKDAAAITRVELVFKGGAAFDPAKLVSDVRGQIDLR